MVCAETLAIDSATSRPTMTMTMTMT